MTWVPRRWLRLPRRTIRLRLTVLYSGVFLLSGAALLGITYALVSNHQPQLIFAGPVTKGAPGGCAVAHPPLLPFDPTNISGCIAYGQSVANAQRASVLRQLLVESAVALGIMTVASLGLGWLVAGRVLRPLRTITAAARSISASNLHARLAMAGPDDELKELGDTFDALLARLEAAFGAQRQFVANASHELRTPLARQRALIEVGLAEPEPTVARLSDMCRRVLATAEQQERLIEALLTLARSQRGLDRLEHVDVAAIADELIETRQAQATSRGVTIRSCVARASAFGDARLIERLMANVLDNALRHNVEHGSVELQVRNLDDHAVLFVANSGPAIERSHVPRLFQPFERGGGNGGDRSVRQEPDGLGLGLSIVSAIASAHGAWLKASALTGGGLAVEVGFPRA